MFKFRKKPVVIEAFQMTKERRWNNADWPQWAHEAWNAEVLRPSTLTHPKIACVVKTLEGEHSCDYDDWIIRGVKNELYPCKPDIFAATYEPVDEAASIR